MIQIFINNQPIQVSRDSTLLEACEFVGISIPKFCFHERLAIAGNCRACLIEVEKSPKPVVSCTLPVFKNLNIYTNSPLVKKARESVLEFLLINHPLDCPVCDQGGECDLQDQSMFFGSYKTRFFENKRSVGNKNCGPLIKTIMTRCIHCTRCIRFFSEYTGSDDLGITNRSNFAEVGTFVNKFFQSELSGNVIDLCPVGALTSKSYAFLTRPWELRTITSVDMTDAIGGFINVDFKETTPVRILPKVNEILNDNWITDKCRFNLDSFNTFRIAAVYVKKKECFALSSWQKCLRYVNYLVACCDIHLVCSVFSSLESLVEAKVFAEQQGIKGVGFVRKFYLNFDFSENFLSNISLLDLEYSDFCLLVGINPKWEASALNRKLLRRFRFGLLNTVSLGIHHKNSFKKIVLGVSSSVITRLAEGTHFLCKNLKKAKTPTILFGAAIAERKDFIGLKKMFHKVATFSSLITLNRNGLCCINQEQNQSGAFFLGFKSFSFTSSPRFRMSQLLSQLSFQNFLINEKVFFFLGSFRTVEISSMEKIIPFKSCRIFMSSHGCDFTAKADLLMPIKHSLEKDGSFMNYEGVVNKTQTTYAQLVQSSKDEGTLLQFFRTSLFLRSDFRYRNINGKFIARYQSRTFFSVS